MTATITRDHRVLDKARAKIAEHEQAIAELQAKIIEHEGDKISLEMWVDIYHELGGEDDLPFGLEGTTPEATETGAGEPETPSEATTPSEPEIPTIPQPQAIEETVIVPEIDLAPVETPKTKKQQVVECHKEHPDWWANKIAEHLGINARTVTGYASTLGLKLARNPNVGGGALARGAKPQEARKSEPALEAPAKHKPRPAAPTEDGEALLERARAVTHPAGTKFRLKHPESGHYLHESLTRDGNKALQVTAYKEFAWCQPEARLLKVRQLHPETAGWGEEVVLP